MRTLLSYRYYLSACLYSTFPRSSAAYVVFAADSLKAEVYVPGHDNHPVLDRRTLPAGGYVWNQEDDDTYNVRRLDGKWVIEQRGKVLYKQADK